MKKLVMFLFVALMWSSQIIAQESILPFSENGHSISKICNLALGSSELSKNYRKELLRIVNADLIATGENMNINNGQPLNESHIRWIYSKVENSTTDLLVGTKNSYRIGSEISFFVMKQAAYAVPTHTFRFRTCSIVIDKRKCGNLLDGVFSNENNQVDPATTVETSTSTSTTTTYNNRNVDRSEQVIVESSPNVVYVDNTPVVYYQRPNYYPYYDGYSVGYYSGYRGGNYHGSYCGGRSNGGYHSPSYGGGRSYRNQPSYGGRSQGRSYGTMSGGSSHGYGSQGGGRGHGTMSGGGSSYGGHQGGGRGR